MASQKVLEIFDNLKELHIAKDSDYAGEQSLSNFKRCEAFGIPAWKGCLIRLSDKYSRLVSLVGKDGTHAVEGESLEDTLMDLSAYAAITLALLRQNKPDEFPTPYSGDDIPTQEEIARWTREDEGNQRMQECAARG